MIRGTVGLGGRGKTLTTVQRLWRLYQAKGRQVYSNTPLIDLRVRRDPVQGWVPVDLRTFGRSWAAGYVMSFEDIYRLDNCNVLLDEVGTWMHRSEWRDLPREVRQFLTQDRREGVDVWWTYRTTRVYHELWDNTGELSRCDRYGSIIVRHVSDPQIPADKPSRVFHWVTPMVHDLYDTAFRVGGGDGTGYGQGKRRPYVVGSPLSRFRYRQELETVGGSIMVADIALRVNQAECLIRHLGPQSVGLKSSTDALGNWIHCAHIL